MSLVVASECASESFSADYNSSCTLTTCKMPSPEEASTSTATKTNPTFKELGVIDPLLDALSSLSFTKPTDIQAEALPYALQGRDIIGVAETGSGKTAAFALPILQKLWEDPQPLFACILAPTRELAYQISQQIEALGSGMGVRCAIIVGGVPMMDQSIALSKRPHIVVATPGRLHDHLENTKGFSLRNLKYLVSLSSVSFLYMSNRFAGRYWMKQTDYWTWTSVPSSTKSLK